MPSRQAGTSSVPGNYIPIPGSERRPSKTARRLGPADPNGVLSVTISLRRRPDGEPVPDDDYFLNVHPAQRQRMPPDAFVRRYGASQEDIDKVVAFANSNQLTVLETDAARRMVIVRGTVAQMNAAFAVDLGHYEHDVKTKL